ncbi:MAG: hypothetical protein P4L84_05300 [Isosphaeraceae bacterium]|nr:hypothetical protein [Isosphaeraceae bacterium]
MPRQNRVTPSGTIIAVPERGTLMGNRGILHNADGQIRRPWKEKRWLICMLEFNGRQRQVMAPNRYTELFFLDEATALAAGHRPCFECRRARFLAFRDAWATGNHPAVPPETIKAGMIDERLHAERLGPGRSKRTFPANVDDLPDGVLITRPDESGGAYLVWGEHLLAWSPGGYAERRQRPTAATFSVLTPRSTVAAIRAGYQLDVHSSVSKAGRTM